jgi:PAS domain S-box-containing protein
MTLQVAEPDVRPRPGRTPTEDLLVRAALAVSSVRGDRVFADLARGLASLLDVDAAFIALRVPGAPGTLGMLAFHFDGALQENFTYEISGTPCEHVVGVQYRGHDPDHSIMYARGLQALFPKDETFVQMGLESYAGYPLNAADGSLLGVMSVASRRAIEDPNLVESIVKMFAVRAAAALERVRATESLRLSEASYRAIFEASEDAIFVHDWDTGKILDASPKASELYGYTHEELLRIRIDEVSAEEQAFTAARAARLIEEAKTGSEPVRFEWRARHRDGHLMWHEVTLKRAVIAGEPRVLAFVRDITARKEADAALRASEEQYRTIFNASADALMLWNKDLERVDVNAAHERIFGYAREDVIGRGFEGLGWPDELVQPRLEMVRRALAGEAVRAELEALRKDGRRIVTELRAIPFQHRGQPHVLQIARDITERKRAEAALRASEEQYRVIFNASADALVLWDAECRRVDVNPAYERLFGASRDEVLGKTFADGLPAGYAERRRGLIRRALAGEACRAELESLRRDGAPIQVEIHTIPVRYRGAPHALAIVRDVTERKQAEAALRASEEQYRAIFNASAETLVLRDEAFRIVDVNPAYESVSGYARSEVLGSDRLVGNPRATEALVRDIHRQALAAEATQLETRIVRRDNSEVDIELRAVPVQYRGRPHVLYAGRDISARKRADAVRAELEAQLRQAQKMEAIGQLTGGIAHDFNNILTSAMGYIGLAAERPAVSTDAKLDNYLEEARKACRRARDLIQQMLTFSRGGSGPAAPVQLAPLLEDAAKLMRSTLPATVALDLSAAAALPPIMADPVQIEQILLNLCINARDAMGGAGTLQVRVECRRDVSAVCTSCRQRVVGDHVEIAVRDDGPGIPADVLDRIFEPFFTTKKAGHGSGMGLAMVHGIVHRHGGHVVVESDLGRGALFRVLFPALTPGEAREASGEPVEPRAGTPSVELHGRALVVDDEESITAVLREILETCGMQVEVAPDPNEALRLVDRRNDSFDLVVTDLTMPGTTGIVLARELRRRGMYCPVLLLTGYGEGLTEQDLREAGVSALVAKPVEPRSLVGTIRELLTASASPA